MVTCQSANQLKTPAKVSWAFKMVSQFGSLGYTIMGKTADLTVVQKTIIDTLHKEDKTQTFITKEAVCSQSAVSKHVNRKLSGRKKMHNQPRELQPYEDCQASDSRICVNFTRNGLRLGSRHQVSRFMGSRSHPHRVLSVCVYVCVSRCLWVCVIEADSLQLRVITVGLYLSLSRSLLCQILAVFAVDVFGPFWFRDSWALLFPGLRSPDLGCPLLPCATRLSPTESSVSAYGKHRVCLRKLRLCPTESSV